jgi:hypothetical protein
MKKAVLLAFFHVLIASVFSFSAFSPVVHMHENASITKFNEPLIESNFKDLELDIDENASIGFAVNVVNEDSIDTLKTAKTVPQITLNNPEYGLMTLGHHRVSYDRGFIIPHHDDMYHLYQPVMSLQYQYLRSFVDSQKRLGLMAYAAHLGSPTLGMGISLGLNIERQFFKIRNTHFRYRYAIGGDVVTQPYHVKSNPTNRAIGSYGNAFGQLYLEGSRRITSRLSMQLGLRFSHFSNGAWKAPNLGINIPSVSIGISKNISTPALVSREVASRLWNPFVSVRTGRKSLDIDDPRAYWVPVLEMGWDYRLSKHSSLRMAIATHADPFYRFKKFEKLEAFTPQNGLDAGISVGYHQRLGKWGMLFDLGWYLYKPNRGYKTPYFEALGISYHFNSHWTAIGRLKANKTTADLIEWGVVYYLN